MKDLKHIRRFNESDENLNISDVSDSDTCAVCGDKLKIKILGEDEVVYLQCSKDKKHINKCLGYLDDLME
jgi:hypothetical protein